MKNIYSLPIIMILIVVASVVLINVVDHYTKNKAYFKICDDFCHKDIGNLTVYTYRANAPVRGWLECECLLDYQNSTRYYKFYIRVS